MSGTKHFLIKDYYPPMYGDRPTPWEITYSCGLCGEELWTQQEGCGSPIGTPEDALEEHIEAEARAAGLHDAAV
jgi:hypothetical protein